MRGETKQATQCRNHYAHHDQPTPHHQMVGSVLNTKSCGGHSTGETPSTIPNLEAKPGSANGTATDRLWESRTPPQHNHNKGEGRNATRRAVPLLSHPHHTHGQVDTGGHHQDRKLLQPPSHPHQPRRLTPIEDERHLADWTTAASTNPQQLAHNPRLTECLRRSPSAWGMYAADCVWHDTPTDLCRPHFASWHGMLYAWSLLHIREGRTATGGATRSSPSVWRRTTASPINPR